MFKNLNCIGCYKRVFDVFYFYIIFSPAGKDCPKIISPFRPGRAKHNLGCYVFKREEEQCEEKNYFHGIDYANCSSTIKYSEFVNTVGKGLQI